jgi:RHS repeat-associated protein
MYEAWGRRKALKQGGAGFADSEPLAWMNRGYTGHEHLLQLKLINMGGRVYDPVLGRFLHPDPHIQAPDNPLNLNRFAYCMNNPLVYTDPNGEFVFVAALIGLAVSAAIDYGVQVAMNYAQGYRGADAWFGQVDFVDVTISGVVGFLTAGSAASIKLADAGVKTASGFSRFLTKPATKQFIKHGSKILAASVDFKPAEGWTVVGDDEKKVLDVGIHLATSYTVDWAGQKVSKQFSDKYVRKKRIEYDRALKDCALKSELDRIRTNFEISQRINSFNSIFPKMRGEFLPMPEILNPMDDLMKAPLNHFPNAIIEHSFDDVNGEHWHINWY